MAVEFPISDIDPQRDGRLKFAGSGHTPPIAKCRLSANSRFKCRTNRGSGHNLNEAKRLFPQLDVAFYFESADTASRRGVMGWQVASETFQMACLQHMQTRDFHVHAALESDAFDFAAKVRAVRPDAKIRWTPFTGFASLSGADILMFPSPALAQFAWRRAPTGGSTFSLCGLTHTISNPEMMSELLQLCAAPLQPWDAIVCTSKAVRGAVSALIDPMRAYLTDRFGAQPGAAMNMPIIPLGVETAQFARDEVVRRNWREKIGIPPDACAVLWLGRFSFHAKAHPFAMYRALESAAQRCRTPIHLIEAGWFADDALPTLFAEARKSVMPSVTSHVLDGRAADVRAGIRSAADVFISLADNVQETFGLTPVEAMAANLPCVVSDWNGYRDTVREGLDGYRIPTFAPPAGLGADLADRLASGVDTYDDYLASVSQSVAVDIGAAADAIVRLAEDPDLRRRLGASAAAHAGDTFDWSRIIPQYEALWAEMTALREAATTVAPVPNLAMPDPFAMFAGYPSTAFSAKCRVWPAEETPGLSHLYATRFTLASDTLVLPEQVSAALLGAIGSSPGVSVGEILALLSSDHRPLAARTLLWLAKWGRVRITPP